MRLVVCKHMMIGYGWSHGCVLFTTRQGIAVGLCRNRCATAAVSRLKFNAFVQECQRRRFDRAASRRGRESFEETGGQLQHVPFTIATGSSKWRAECPCGWHGPERTGQRAADLDCNEHVASHRGRESRSNNGGDS
jgi:hypothetical protein